MKKIIFTLIMVFTLMQTFAQVNDPVVIGGAQKGDSNATVEILSKNGTKGFMPPRLTQVQITALQASLKAENNGLTVYNTDEKCLQSWKGDVWTECNPVLIAKFDVDCSQSAIKGAYYKDVPVSNNEYLELSVVVKKAGSYTFVAETQNGVRFFLSSVISTVDPAPQKIKIPAFGTPTETGTFNYNVVDQSGNTACSGLSISVTENNAVFTFDCANVVVNGNFNEGKPVTGSDYLLLNVNVTKTGNYTFKTEIKNGLSFLATGAFNYPGSNSVILRAVAGSEPTWNAPDGIITFDILDKNNASLGCSVPVQVTSSTAEVTVDCSPTGATYTGLLIAGQDPSLSDKLKIKMNVTKIGPWSMETTTVNGLKFADSGTFVATGQQEVLLGAVGKPSTAGVQNYSLIDKLSAKTLCSGININVQANEAVFAANSCTSPQQYGTWKMYNKVTDAGFRVTLTASQAGPYQLTANAAGITLKASGTAVAGAQSITFVPVDLSAMPDKSGSVSFPIQDRKGSDVCAVNVTITSVKGTKDNPGKDCADILADSNNGATDGEYWINPEGGASSSSTDKTYKTLCDMTGGGYTLVWSYSEKTGMNVYTPVGYSTVDGGGRNFYENYPRNQNNYASEVVNYEDFRLPLATMRAIAPQNQLYFKVRIASGLSAAGDMSDANGMNNYAMFSPKTGYDFRYNALSDWNNFRGTGKLLGVAFGTGSNGTGYYGNKTTGVQIAVYSTGGYGFHLDWPNGSPSGEGSPNYFGWWGEDGQVVNGHFYDCKIQTNLRCNTYSAGSNGAVVSPNNRVVQYFMK